jgi:hypothetical protein
MAKHVPPIRRNVGLRRFDWQVHAASRPRRLPVSWA